MTREIKFRAWHRGYPKSNMLPVFTPCMIYEEKCGDVLRWLVDGQPVDAMQYIGIKDRNGKDIYEGDIVKDSEETYIVKFGPFETIECDGIGFFLESTGHGYVTRGSVSSISFHDEEVMEVIGNIYENPELLTDKK